MREILHLVEGQENVYVLHNKRTNATIECTKGYLAQWLARGFEVVEIRLPDRN